MNIEVFSNLAVIAGCCIGAVNIIVEVLKAFWLKKEASATKAVVIVSEIMALSVMYTYCTIENISFDPMFLPATLVGGFFIAYGAMFGYEKLYGKFFENIRAKFPEKEDEYD